MSASFRKHFNEPDFSILNCGYTKNIHLCSLYKRAIAKDRVGDVMYGRLVAFYDTPDRLP